MLWSSRAIHVCKNTDTLGQNCKMPEEMCIVYTVAHSIIQMGKLAMLMFDLLYLQGCHGLESRACTFLTALWLPQAFTCIICFSANINTCEGGIIPPRSHSP